MALPSDEEELKKVVSFAISRWLLEHHFEQIQMQGLFLGIRLTPSDYLKIVKAYADKRDVNSPCSDDFDLREWMQ
ncbi:MAG: hypothetical protein ABSD31_20335 [Candidatus Binataceae bacterium]|jgi:hypothetical protein